MNGPTIDPGQDFSGPYRDNRDADQRAEDRVGIDAEAELMATAAPAYYEALIGAAQNRRSGIREATQIERVGRETTVVVVPGELLVRTPTTDEGMVLLRERLGNDGLGFTEYPAPPELDGRIMRWRNPRVPADELDGIARGLRAERFVVSVNHIVPLNPWMKGQGGPNPTRSHAFLPQGDPVSGNSIAVIDTGIVAKRPDGWLDGISRTTPDGASNIDILQWPGDLYLGLGAGHGTFVAGILAQVARVTTGADAGRPAAPIIMYRALDIDGVGSEVDIAVAMIRAVRAGALIINMSIGTQTLDDQPPVAIQAALELIDVGGRSDVVVVAAAGNYGDCRPCWPAAFREVVSVGALTNDMGPAAWSSRGFWVECSTVGQGIVSTYVPGQEAPIVDPKGQPFPADAWAVWLGTSFAAPQVAGLVARLSAEEGISPRMAMAKILAAGVLMPEFGKAVRILPGT